MEEEERGGTYLTSRWFSSLSRHVHRYPAMFVPAALVPFVSNPLHSSPTRRVCLQPTVFVSNPPRSSLTCRVRRYCATFVVSCAVDRVPKCSHMKLCEFNILSMILQPEQRLTRIISETQTSWSSESTRLSNIMKLRALKGLACGSVLSPSLWTWCELTLIKP